MAAVNFYRFASAIMELLDPKPQTYDLPNESSIIPVVLKAESNSISLDDAKTVAFLAETVATDVPQSKDVEAKTVEIVAANLSQVLSNASDEKLAQVAEVIKQVAVETTTTNSTQATLLTQAMEQSKTANSVTKASQIVQSTVTALAKQTVEEIKVLKTESAVSKINVVEVVTTVLTDKIQQKNADAADSLSKQDIEKNEPVKSEPADFWLSYKEIDPTQIQYSGAISYLYDYMTDRSLLNLLDPAIEYDKRQTLMDEVIGMAQKKSVWESNLESVLKYDSNAHLEKTKDDEYETDLADVKKHTELLQKQRLESQKLAERIAAERMKQSM